MYDVAFYMRHSSIHGAPDYETLEAMRNREPVVYNIETTNACNMRCVMCPRTTMMTRPVETMDPALFRDIVGQIEPHKPELWAYWRHFVSGRYGIAETDMSENHFFLYVIPKVVQLHGYGDPLLDRNMASYVRLLTDKGLQSYFSCNPANISVARTIEMFENGLTYIKYSIESIHDDTHRRLRGRASDFSNSYASILRILELKKDLNLKTVVVVTMLDLARTGQEAEYRQLRQLFADKDVYIYLKSEDTQWYRQKYHRTQSIHWLEPCKHPWMSMTIKSNGEATQCMEDFDNAIVLGDAKTESLYDIWNGDRYDQFRQGHLDLTVEHCMEQCDMKLMGSQNAVDCGNRHKPQFGFADCQAAN